jgi:hypothetical protein
MNQNQQQGQRRSKPVDPKLYSFDIGLSKITTARIHRQPLPLPNSTEIKPSIGKMEQRLDMIVDLKSFDSILLDVMQPNVKNRSVLVPVHFRARLNTLRDSLRKGLEKKGGKEEAELEALLMELETQLSEGTGHSELLDQYRLMILMG